MQTPVVVTGPPPGVEGLPLVCDSPHSGTHYPPDFVTLLPIEQLRLAEDTHVAALWSDAPFHGATLLAAQFPRAYIDANRALDDLDPALLDGPWPVPLNPGPKSRLGYGLVWSRVAKDRPLYEGPLSPAAVQARIDGCWKPYHAALAQAVARAVQTFGALWHLNLHSMPDDAYQRLGLPTDRPLADFVLGDRDGTTAEASLLDTVERSVRAHGYTVARNDPYKGVELIGQIGNPALGRHSLQIEIRRPVYMDELTRLPNAGFAPLQRCLNDTMAEVAQHVRRQLARR